MNAGAMSTDTDDAGTDPRRIRSRARLLDAASSLLAAGGIEAVTVDAVTKVSRVARTTLYRHFESTTDLLAAAFDRLLPQVSEPPAAGETRERMLALLTSQADMIEQAPLQLTTLAWLAMNPEEPGPKQNRLAPLRERVVAQYREPFDRLLTSTAIRDELDDFDVTVAITQLVGPLIFAKLSGIRVLTATDLACIVDDFLAAHRHRAPVATDQPR
jgi:AcrR family transcriptional regulator